MKLSRLHKYGIFRIEDVVAFTNHLVHQYGGNKNSIFQLSHSDVMNWFDLNEFDVDDNVSESDLDEIIKAIELKKRINQLKES